MYPFAYFLHPMPSVFWSEYLERPFEECLDCSCPLSEQDFYLIQKQFVVGETVFEMALCGGCRQNLQQQYSAESAAAITTFLTEALKNRTLPEELDVTSEQSASQLLQYCLNHCMICGIDRAVCRRYSLAGLFQQSQIIVQCGSRGQVPLMICDRCEQQMSGLISQTTRDNWNRFVEEHFDGPPEMELEQPGDRNTGFLM
ncbi:MAG: hypothetical protein KDA85_20325 [Planctomycetaceae bacterium]|nr:hypothetical protein [Planctomycetaceae bacterium]